MKNRFATLKRGLATVLTAALTVTGLPAAAWGADKAEAANVTLRNPRIDYVEEETEGTDGTLKNPRIVEDDNMKAGQKVTWDCVYFGSYPQAEVIPDDVEYTEVDESQRQDGDVIISDSVYKALQSASEWDSNNDITMNGVKYRRMKKGDATYSHKISVHERNEYNWKDDTTYHYFKYEPIKWRVLHTDGNQALLLSDLSLDDKEYHRGYESVTWETSTLRSWLNGYGAGSNKRSMDYSRKNFISSAFTDSEQAAIVNTSLENADNITYNTEGGNDTTDRIFLLSETEVWNTDKAESYGFVKDRETSDEARDCQRSTYARAMGACGNWWLRSPGEAENTVLGVYGGGCVYEYGTHVNYSDHGVRPVLNLNLSFSNLYTYAGTLCSKKTKTTKVTWDCVWFGRYPQAEVIPSGVEYAALGESLRQDGDVIVSDSVYAALQSASGWDANNDITLNGEKYRRMKKKDATNSFNDEARYNWADDTTYHYFKYEPIKWRVLHIDGNQALLLADIALDDQKYHTESENVTWETSTLRSWLNGYGPRSNRQFVDYSQKNFIASAFGSSEREAIISSPLENADNTIQKTEGGNNTTDKVFLLSESEVCSTDRAESYGFEKDKDIIDIARRCQSSTYAKAMGISSHSRTSRFFGKSEWWLRTPGGGEDDAMCVLDEGGVYSLGSSVNYFNNGVRPALNLNLSFSDFYEYAGTVCADGTKEETGKDWVSPGIKDPEPSKPDKPVITEPVDVTLKNPRIVADNSMEAGQKVTWDCLYFGSYPQAEVIPGGVKYTALDESLRRDGDVIISDSVYASLQNASGWDANNDVTLNGVKYRRMKQEDAAYTDSDSEYYQWSNDTDYHYFKYEPIKWRVLRTDGNQALLLSDIVLDNQQYHTVDENVTWEISTLLSWLNGYESGYNKQFVDYSQKNFLSSAFNTSEQEAIVNSSQENADNITYGTEGGNHTTDKIFLLSESDVWNTDTAKAHGFVKDGDTYDEARRCQSSTYAKAMGIYSDTDTDYAGNGWWWLRSPGYSAADALRVSYAGDINGSNVGDDSGIRPALNLNRSSLNLCTYAGTVCSDGTVSSGIKDPVPSNPEQPVTPKPGKPDEKSPAIGTKLTDAAGKAVYKVTDAGKVEYTNSLKKKSSAVTVPEKVTLDGKSYQVTAIGNSAFKNCKKLKTVVIGKGVTSIGAKAFNGCKALKKITIKSTKLKKVGKSAFKGIHAKAVIKVPKAKLKAYQKLLKKKGQGKKVRITK